MKHYLVDKNDIVWFYDDEILKDNHDNYVKIYSAYPPIMTKNIDKNSLFFITEISEEELNTIYFWNCI